MGFRMRDKRNILSNSRINFLIAIVFLFGLLSIYRLYELQILKYDFYIVKAEGQHQVYNVLEPERGEIFMEERTVNGELALYPFATNKDFAHLYAIPADIGDPRALALKFFLIFDYNKVKREVDEYFKERDEAELEFQLNSVSLLPKELRIKEELRIKDNLLKLWQDSTWLEARQIEKEKEIDRRKGEYVDKYFRLFSKKNDPYESIRRKVSEEELLEIYAVLLSDDERQVSSSSLAMDEGLIYRRAELEKDPENKPESISIEGISYIIKKYRYYPESEVGAHLSGFVSLMDEEQRGSYGLEGFFDNELFGKFGEMRSERGASRGVIIVNDREYTKPENGSDLSLSINHSIQFAACQKLSASIEKHEADSGTVLIMDPRTGAILAMCSYPSYDPNNYNRVENIEIFNNPAIFEQYEPGSVFKTITMAAAIDSGKVSPSTIYEDKGSIMIEGWDKPIRNSDIESAGSHGWVDMSYTLTHSLNTGSIFAMEQVGAERFADYVVDFGLGQKTGIELETESPGNIDSLLRKRIRPVEAATASFGQGITVTALQMVSAYSAIANYGILMKPYVVKEIVASDGTRSETRPVEVRRVISEKAADIILSMLANVVEGGHASLAKVSGYYVGGKTGTAQVASKDELGYSEDERIHTFIGLAPVSDPRFVMLVKLNNSKTQVYSSMTAAPLFGEIAEFILSYYEIPKER